MNHVPGITATLQIDAFKGAILPFLADCNAGLWPIDLMSDPCQGIDKKLDIIRIQASVIFEEDADLTIADTAVKNTVAQIQGIPHKLGGGAMAATAFTTESGLSAHLCKQHVVDSINLVTCEVVILKKQDKVIVMVTTLQPAISNAEEFTCKVTCMPVTGGTTVIP